LIKRSLVVIQAEPLHALDDRLYGCRRRPFQIGILDTQNKGAAEMAGIGPGEQRSTGAAYVKIAGGAWGKTGANSHGKEKQPWKTKAVIDKNAILPRCLPRWQYSELGDPQSVIHQLRLEHQPFLAGQQQKMLAGTTRQ